MTTTVTEGQLGHWLQAVAALSQSVRPAAPLLEQWRLELFLDDVRLDDMCGMASTRLGEGETRLLCVLARVCTATRPISDLLYVRLGVSTGSIQELKLAYSSGCDEQVVPKE